MSSLSNHLIRLQEEQQKTKYKNDEIKQKFNELHLSFLAHLDSTVDGRVTEHNNVTIKKIIIYTSLCTFIITGKLEVGTQTAHYTITEDNLKEKFRFILKFLPQKRKWLIIKTSHKKMIYFRRYIKPVMIESFVIILTKYL